MLVLSIINFYLVIVLVHDLASKSYYDIDTYYMYDLSIVTVIFGVIMIILYLICNIIYIIINKKRKI